MGMITLADIQHKIAQNQEIILLDCRTAASFDEAYIAGSIYVGNQIVKKTRLLKLPPEQEILILLEEKETETIEIFNKMGFENVKTVVPFEDITELAQLGLLDLMISIDPDELAMDLPFDEKARIIDLREEDQFEKAHIEGAENITLEEFSDVGTIAEIEENENIYLYGNPDDVSFVGSLIKRQGVHNFRKIQARFEDIAATENIKIEKAKSPNPKQG
jgi:rhodanese-related sulfurtransferase